MFAFETDERDCVLESDSAGYRVFYYDDIQASVEVYDVDDATPSQVEEWAVVHARGRAFRIAGRILMGDARVHVVWLTPRRDSL